MSSNNLYEVNITEDENGYVNTGSHQPDEDVYDDVPVSSKPIQPMSISEPKQQTDKTCPGGMVCSWKKMCCLILGLIVIVLVSCSVGGFGAYFGSQGASNKKDPVVLCPSVTSSFASSITFSSPTIGHFSHNTDVSIIYSSNGQQIAVIPSSTSLHSLEDFPEGSTTVTIEATDLNGNEATCEFTYTRIPVPIIVCPFIADNESSSINFSRPILENFQHPELVHITYSSGGRLLITIPATESQHELHDFDVGTTLITAVASDSNVFASCEFIYSRLPVIQCLESSTSKYFPRPTTNFVATRFFYSRYGKLFTSTSTLYYRDYVFLGETANVTVGVAGGSGYSVSCTVTWSPKGSEGSVRLIDGKKLYEGRVEVFHDDVWGTVCDNGWDTFDAQTVCRHLGFPSGEAKALTDTEFGQGSGEIWLDNIDCASYDIRLYYCDHNGWGITDCDHSDDAGAICTDGVYSTT